MKQHTGFTLIESIMAIVLLAFAMLMLSRLLYPQITQSARPHYQTRAASLGQSLMQQILARPFDQQSDTQNGGVRCDKLTQPKCTVPSALGDDGEPTALFNDVDDFIGCWYSDKSTDCPSASVPIKPLHELLLTNNAQDFAHFTVTIKVCYWDFSGECSEQIELYKHIRLTIDTGRYGSYKLTALRGNY